jgi:hypothetical protein
LPRDGQKVVDEWRSLALAATSEAEWKETVMKLLRFGGWQWFSVKDGRKMNTILDITAWRERLIHIELKTEKGRLTKDRFVDGHFVKGQATLIPELEAAGQEVYVWRPSDYRWARWVLVDAWRRTTIHQAKEYPPDVYEPQ